MSPKAYEIWDQIKLDNDHQKKQQYIDNYNFEKINQELFNDVVMETLNNIERNLSQKLENLDLNSNKIEIERMFTSEININIPEVGVFQIYEDVAKQCLMVVSPVNGPYCFQWNEIYQDWSDIGNEYQLQGFLETELSQYLDGFLFE